MIQRKQSIWLFIAALLNAGVFYFDLYRAHMNANGADIIMPLRVADHFPSLLIALLMTALPFISIFMFGNRKQQIRMSFGGILAIVAFITLLMFRVTSLDKLIPPPTSGTYWIGSVLPVISVVFMFMAIAGIRRDDKLVKSVDRLR